MKSITESKHHPFISLKKSLKKIAKPFYQAISYLNLPKQMAIASSLSLEIKEMKASLEASQANLAAHSQAIEALALKPLLDRIQSETCVTQLIAQTPDGLFCFDIRDHVVGWHIALFKTWEQIETDFIKKIIQENDSIIDIGANLGWYTVLFGNLVGEKGSVIAFEPEPLNFDLLSKNIALNSLSNRIKSFQLALLNTDSEIIFELSSNNFGDHRPRAHSQALQEERLNESSRAFIKVPARTLDSIMANQGLSNTRHKLLKIDSQGCEVAIFQGAQQTLNNCEYMITEFWPYGLNRAGAKIEEWFDLVKPHFHEFARLNSQMPSYQPIEALREDIYKEMDIDPGPLGYTNYILRKSQF